MEATKILKSECKKRLPHIPKVFSGMVSHHIEDVSFDFSKMKLYQSKKQSNPIANKAFGGQIIGQELKGKKKYSASFLDFLLDNPKLIPKEWRFKYIFFPGTVYNYLGDEVIRCLSFNELGEPRGDEFFWLMLPFTENFYFLVED
jgi:hypothetical protein